MEKTGPDDEKIPSNSSLHGQLMNEVLNDAVLARTYDSLNRPTGYSLNPVHPVNPVEVNYAYDAIGRLASVVPFAP